MIRNLLFALFILLTLALSAQEGIRHQGVLRENGVLVQNENIAVQYMIRQGSATGTMLYNETANLTTNSYGQFAHTVGSINPNNFATIDWSQGDFFLEVIVNGTNLGTTEITKVPLAYYADRVDMDLGELQDVSVSNPDTGHVVFYNGSSWESGLNRERMPIAWAWVQAGSLNYEGYGIASITSPTAGEYDITLTESINGWPCVIATAFTRTGAAEITGYVANSGSNVITIKVFDANNPANLKISDFSFVVYDN